MHTDMFPAKVSGVNVKETAKRLGVHVKSMDLLAHNCAANVSGLAAFIPDVCVYSFRP